MTCKKIVITLNYPFHPNIPSLLDTIIAAMLRRNIPGSGFLSRLFKKDQVLVENAYGVKMQLNPAEYLEKEIIATGYYEPEVIDRLITAAQGISQPVLWDIGANVGLHSLTFKKTFPASTVCSFEPFHVNFRKLAINESLNPELRVKKFNFGLSKKIEVNNIYTTSANAGRTSFKKLDETKDLGIHILSCDGNYVVDQKLAPYPDIIKIDVEDLELAVFLGSSKVLDHPKLKTIIFEGPAELPKSDEVANLLRKHGFEITMLQRDRLEAETNRNYVATRNNVKSKARNSIIAVHSPSIAS